MKKYLVGGAVRDQLLGLPVRERDWVVVGGTIEDLVNKGFTPVGKSFPVFLHPKTHDEYALARTERKISKGYKGFEVYASKDVTLEEDLIRRDLTINAMAMDDAGTIIDPFGGKSDLKKKVLRHVSNAFSEDPVRILRVARFAARFKDFTVAPETTKLMKKMVESGETSALIPERVWQELSRALQEKYPYRFIETLRECGALAVIFPEIDKLFGTPASAKWHPEIDTGIHTLMALKQAVKLSNDNTVRFAVLVHDLGKGETPKDILPHHYGHEKRSVTIVRKLCKRLRVPTDYRNLAIIVARYHSLCHKIFELNPSTILRVLRALDPFRRPERFKHFLTACEADSRGRKGAENMAYPQADFLASLYEKCVAIDEKALIEKIENPAAIPQAIHRERLKIVRESSKAIKKLA